MTSYERLAQLGLQPPPLSTPLGNYVPAVGEGKLLYLFGQGPREADSRFHFGTVGADVTIEQAQGHARLVGLNLLAAMHAE